MRALRFVYRKLLPLNFGRRLDLFRYLRGSDPLSPAEIEQGKSVLVFSPHPDDDIIGCGGTLCKHSLAGNRIVIVYVTDGRKGGSSYNEEELVRIRMDEARRAAGIIGVDELIFLGLPDGELKMDKKNVMEIVSILRNVKPDIVFLPFLMDNHGDHMATNDIFVKASRVYNMDFICYGYEVWTPLSSPNFVVDISKELPIKIAALKQHESQIRECDFIDAFTGLSRYRGALHKKGRSAEAFVRCSVTEYRRLWEVVR